MAEDTKTIALGVHNVPSTRESVGPPMIYFDSVPTYGAIPGVVQITLCAQTPRQGDSVTQIISDRAVTAYLRCNLVAAQELRSALDAAISLLSTPKELPN